MRRKTTILISAGIAVVIALLTFLISARAPVFMAESCIIVRPFTNVFFAPLFETQTIATHPGLARLRVTPAFTRPAGTSTAFTTNGVAIHMMAIGPTAERAKTAANDAARGMCRTVSTNYGVTAEVLQEATSARSCSYLEFVLWSSLRKVGN
jgi:hypothetical protein